MIVARPPGGARAARSDTLPGRHGGRRRIVGAGAAEGPAREEARGGHRESPAPRPSRPLRRLAGLTVLVVDDDPGSLDYFEMALMMVGATVATATTAEAALGLVRERRPDVVVSDIAMPGHDGYWLVAQIRRLPEPLCRVPVLATTAYGRSHPRERALETGFVDHLPKPVEPDQLLDAVARAAGRA